MNQYDNLERLFITWLDDRYGRDLLLEELKFISNEYGSNYYDELCITIIDEFITEGLDSTWEDITFNDITLLGELFNKYMNHGVSSI